MYKLAVKGYKYKEKDLEFIKEVERALVVDWHKDAPSISELSKLCFMSGSKLKTLFKKTYGTSMYNYYLVNKMKKAKDIILLNKISVNQVSQILGYKGETSFKKSFYNVHKIYPEELKSSLC